MNKNQQVTLPPSRLPVSPELAKEYDVSRGQWRVLVQQIFPTAQSAEAVFMALDYCRSRNLDIMKRPVHIVPMWDSKKKQMVETVWPGISEIRTTAHRTGAYAGIDGIVFGKTKTETFKGQRKVGGNWEDEAVKMKYPESATATVYRLVQGQRVSFTATVYWLETYATANNRSEVPNGMWRKRAFGQLAKCAEVAALRMAFPEEIGNEYAAEEMAGQVIEHEGKAAESPAEDVPPPPPLPAPEEPEAPPAPPEAEETAKKDESSAPDAGDLLEKAEKFANQPDNLTELEEAFANFEEHHREQMNEDDWAIAVNLFAARRSQLEAMGD